MPLEGIDEVHHDQIVTVSAHLARLSPDRLAILQRMDPFGRGNHDFWLLYAHADLTGPSEVWIRQVRLMAWLTVCLEADLRLIGPHVPGRSLGAILRQTGYTEERILGLLSIPPAARWEHLDQLVRWLASRWDKRGVDCLTLWQLQQGVGRIAERRIAADFFAGQILRGGQGNRHAGTHPTLLQMLRAILPL